jgi:hypothetical protein
MECCSTIDSGRWMGIVILSQFFCVCRILLYLQYVLKHSANVVRSYTKACRRVFTTTTTLLHLVGSESSCDLGNVTYKLNLKNYIYNCNIYILNLVGRSIGKCLHNRLVSGGSLRFKISLFGCTLKCLLYW